MPVSHIVLNDSSVHLQNVMRIVPVKMPQAVRGHAIQTHSGNNPSKLLIYLPWLESLAASGLKK